MSRKNDCAKIPRWKFTSCAHYPRSSLSSAHLMFPSCRIAMQNLSHWLRVKKTRRQNHIPLDCHGQPAAHLGTLVAELQREVVRSHNTPLSQKVQKGKEKLALAAGKTPKKWSCDSCAVLDVCVQRLQALWWTLSSCSFHPSPPTRRMSAQLLFNYAKNTHPHSQPADWLTALAVLSSLVNSHAYKPSSDESESRRRDAPCDPYGPAATASLSVIAALRQFNCLRATSAFQMHVCHKHSTPGLQQSNLQIPPKSCAHLEQSA